MQMRFESIERSAIGKKRTVSGGRGEKREWFLLKQCRHMPRHSFVDFRRRPCEKDISDLRCRDITISFRLLETFKLYSLSIRLFFFRVSYSSNLWPSVTLHNFPLNQWSSRFRALKYTLVALNFSTCSTFCFPFRRFIPFNVVTLSSEYWTRL